MYKDKIVKDVRSLRQKLSNQMGLPFQDILPAEQVAQAIKTEGVPSCSLLCCNRTAYTLCPYRGLLSGEETAE